MPITIHSHNNCMATLIEGRMIGKAKETIKVMEEVGARYYQEWNELATSKESENTKLVIHRSLVLRNE